MPPATTERGYANDTGGAFWNHDHEDAPELRWPLSVWVYDAMRREDAQTASVLPAVTLPVRRTAWRIDPAGSRQRGARTDTHPGWVVRARSPSTTSPRGRM